MDGLRKVANYVEDVFMEGGRSGRPTRVAAVAAVIANPWAGRGFVEDLAPEILTLAPQLGDLLVPRLLDLLGGGDKIEAFGKAAVVGASGEIEHASALIHTLRFGNILRHAVGGKSFLPFTNVRGATGSPIFIPLVDKNDSGRRSHYLTISFAVPDAPGPDELVAAIAGATGGRLHPRIGDRYQDMAELEGNA